MVRQRADRRLARSAEPASTNPFEGLLINEILAHTAEPQPDFVELFNAADRPLDLTGVRVTDHPARAGFAIPPGTTVPPHGFVAFDEHQLGFALGSAGESLFLLSPDGTRVIDGLRYGAQAAGVSFGRTPDGSPDFRELRRPTAGAANDRRLARPIVISEIQYHPISENPDDEFVELRNRGDAPVDLGGWRFTDGIEFEFAAGTRIAPGEHLAVARNRARLLGTHPGLPAARVVGDFTGALADRGERLALAMPEVILSTSATGLVTTNRLLITVCEVTWRDGGAWGQWSDGGGSSLELRDPRADVRRPSSWADSDETTKAPWTLLETRGTLDLGVGTIDQLQLVALGAGSWLVDDVQVVGAGGNLIGNATFDGGITRWVCQGTMSQSTWEPAEGAAAPGALRVEAVARGDTGANRIRTPLSGTLNPGNSATLRARVRWLRGHPEFLLRLRGNYLEAVGQLTVPGNLGTPGAPNSRALDNAGPVLTDLRQTPILPAAGQPVVVTVRVDDPDDLTSVTLAYRLDPGTALSEIRMTDDGTGDDARAGDGVWTATVPGQAAGGLVAWQITATDAAAAPRARASTTFPAGEALIRWGETQPSGTLGTYRLWMTQATFSRWSSRPKLDNSPVPVTFVYNAERVIHGVGALFAGSPHISPSYSTPSGNLCGYTLIFPADEPFLGATDVVLDWPGRDTTAQQEPMAYWIAREIGAPFNHRRFIRLHVNGVTETTRGSVYEDAQQVNSDLVQSWNPEAASGRADLFKIEQWFEFSDGLATTQVGPPRLENYTTTGGVKKLARYRWNWLRRAAGSTASDYGNLYDLVDAANAPDPAEYVRRLSEIADLEEWMRIFATENIVVNLDAWGYDIGKNMYACRPPGKRWQIHMWDIDWVMLASAQHGYSPTSPLMYRGPAVFGDSNRDPVVGRMYDEPVFQRAYWRAIEDAVNGPLRSEAVAARMDATYAALVKQGVTRSSGGSLSSPAPVKTWLAQRRAYLVQQLAGVTAAFAVTPPPAVVSASHLLTLSGTAPVALTELRVNGRPSPLIWNSVGSWTTTVSLGAGVNVLDIVGYDRLGRELPSARTTATVRFDGVVPPLPGGVVLNEWLAASTRGAANPVDGNFDDWFELYNSSGVSVDLGGWFLTDDPKNPTRSPIPAGTVIPAHGFLLVWADGEPSRNGLGPGLHADFRLSQSGEYLALVTPRQIVADQITFGAQTADVSEGRWPDGAPLSPVRLGQPTPGAPNLPPPGDPALIITALRMTPEGHVTVTWRSTPGFSYRLESCTGFPGGSWGDVTTDLTATASETSATDPSPGAVARFYRVRRQTGG